MFYFTVPTYQLNRSSLSDLLELFNFQLRGGFNLEKKHVHCTFPMWHPNCLTRSVKYIFKKTRMYSPPWRKSKCSTNLVQGGEKLHFCWTFWKVTYTPPSPKPVKMIFQIDWKPPLVLVKAENLIGFGIYWSPLSWAECILYNDIDRSYNNIYDLTYGHIWSKIDISRD